MPLYIKFINKTKNGKRVQDDGKRVKKSTVKNYLDLQRNLENFEKKKGVQLRVRDIDSMLGKKLG